VKLPTANKLTAYQTTLNPKIAPNHCR